METEIVTVDAVRPQPGPIARAAQILLEGGLVAFPTETVYGLGGNALDEAAAKKIYVAKGRPSDNPLIAHIASFAELPALVREIPPAARLLMERYWPGPMTLIFPKSDLVPYSTTGGLDTVAVRMPSHPVARAMIEAAHVPVAAPSANLSGRPSPTKAEHVKADLSGRIDMILDAGPVGIGVESTIIDVTSSVPALLRPGFISQEMLEEILGELTVDAASTGPMSPDAHPKAPGMKYRHYAPQADMTLVHGDENAVAEAICRMAAEYVAQGAHCVILSASESAVRYEMLAKSLNETGRGGILTVLDLGSRHDTQTVARNLFDSLRSCDDMGADVIISEVFEEGQLGGAVMNRLRKAAGYQILDV